MIASVSHTHTNASWDSTKEFLRSYTIIIRQSMTIFFEHMFTKCWVSDRGSIPRFIAYPTAGDSPILKYKDRTVQTDIRWFECHWRLIDCSHEYRMEEWHNSARYWEVRPVASLPTNIYRSMLLYSMSELKRQIACWWWEWGTSDTFNIQRSVSNNNRAGPCCLGKPTHTVEN